MPAYGLWLLVSYGRQGSRGFKGRNGNVGGQINNNSGSGQSNGKQTGSGKNVSIISSNGKRFVDEADDILRGKTFKERSNAKAKNLNNSSNNIVTPRSFSQNNKKVVKRGKKHAVVVGLLEDNRKRVDFFKKSFGLDKIISSFIPNPCEPDSEALDNAAILRQLYSDVNNFDGNSTENRETGDGPSIVKKLGPTMDNFDRVASELGEAMAVISK
ncbi:hypothetical protein QYF36_003596 [Acer negundo]|nr:hypothetical protein QYF36_003596 [Acer negundo]